MTSVIDSVQSGWNVASGHLKGFMEIESTVRYLGIEVDDAIEIAEKIGI